MDVRELFYMDRGDVLMIVSSAMLGALIFMAVAL